MNYRHISLECLCGQVPDRIAEVGLTDEHMLVVHWWCTHCHKVVYVSKPLTDCWRECPSTSTSLDNVLPLANRNGYEDQDAQFLRSIGVQL